MAEDVGFDIYFDRFQDWHAYAVETLGATPEQAYKAWRRAWFELTQGKSWRNRRKGIKRKRAHYTDASTLTEEIAG